MQSNGRADHLNLTRVLPPASTSRFAHLCRSRPRGSIHSLPTLAHYFPRSFTFYVAHPDRSILRKHGYPPDLQDEATKLVLAQAELLCAEWAA
jgi:restriction endonuclease HindI-like protein